MEYEHLLVAVDLTEECDPVIKRAKAIALANGAKVSRVHIVEPMAM
ncbi:universal stress protein, partial [Pseudomonas donghuensis]|nr:universal stress protein [Pseudomonas donghuensis]